MQRDWRAHELRYGRRHRELRRQLAGRVAAGQVVCARCGEVIVPGERWDLGHVDGAGPHEYAGAEHARCNRQTARHALERRRRVDLAGYEDDPSRGVFFGPPGVNGRPLRWSREWSPWRDEVI